MYMAPPKEASLLVNATPAGSATWLLRTWRAPPPLAAKQLVKVTTEPCAAVVTVPSCTDKAPPEPDVTQFWKVTLRM
jgi:hypothetical protein